MRERVITLLVAILLCIPTLVFADNSNETNKSNTINPTQAQTMEMTPNMMDIEYQYNEETNTVLAKVTSKVPFADTKISWNLSEDKLSYTYEFTENTNYTTTFEDIEGNQFKILIKVTQIDDKEPNLEIHYQYISETNSVKVTVSSDEPLKPTKVNWNLSEDKLSYTYEFIANTIYTTSFQDIYGNTTNIEINVTQIDDKGPKITISYHYLVETNSVIATVISDEPLKATKTNWKLSEDALTYTYEFTANTTYVTGFQDVYGNQTNIEINVTQIDDQGPKLTISYKYILETNSVIATVVSNEPLKATKTNWALSQDALTYTYEFVENTTYTTGFQDIYGNETKIEISVTQVDHIAPKITANYILNDDNTVTVQLVSNEPLGATKVNWTLSEDQKTYSYTFSENTNYGTTFQDLVGNETVVRIEYTIKEYTYSGTPNIVVTYLYAGNETVTTRVTSDIKFKDTKKNWKLSKDGYSYTYVFTENSVYKTDFEDINENIRTVDILVNFFETKSRYNGVDVSFYQRYVMWNQVKASGIDFAMIRAGFRGYGSSGSMNLDPYFETNLKNAALNGLDIGIYFYSQAITVEEAIEEADFVLNLLKTYNIEIKYPIAIDTERTPGGTGRADALSAEQRTDICIAFCERIEQAGYKSMIYANKDWLLNNLNLNRLSDYDIWLAHYTNETDFKYAYTMWQYTSTGAINGIIGNVDMNYCYKKY